MKEKILAVVLLILVIAFVAVNTVVLDKQISKTINQIRSLDLEDEHALENARTMYADFLQTGKYISLTVSHADLTSIEDSFVEMIGHMMVGNIKDAQVTKDRLISFLKHLRRLSGFNIDGVI